MTTNLITAIQRWIGTSTDTKPTLNVNTGSTFYETDTKTLYVWSGSAWVVDLRTITSFLANILPTFNSIGIPGELGFGVGICPSASMPAGFTPMSGCYDPASPNYGNYQYLDGSVMVWIPKFYYRIHEGWKAITAVTEDAPAATNVQITSVGHGLVTGDKIFICQMAVGGAVELNSKFYTVTRVDNDLFVLQGILAAGVTAYTSGGYFVKGVGAAFDFNRTLIDHEMNSVGIKAAADFASTAAANAMGYALHRAFIDGNAEQLGFFVDKYKVSTQAWGTGYIASSLRYGDPISTASTHNPVATITAAGSSNTYGAMVDAVKGRGETNGVKNASSNFFCCSRFIHAALAMLALAHGQAAQGVYACAWYNATTTNFPKGCNSGVLKDTNDSDVTYVGDGYAISATSFCGKTGSGVPFAKTTHNGQDSGVADLNGLMYEVALGMTCVASNLTITGISNANPCEITTSGNHGLTTGDMVQIASIAAGTLATAINDKLWQITTTADPTKFTIVLDSGALSAWASGGTVTKGVFYTAKQATAMKSFTSGATGATDHWGATGVAAMMDAISAATVATMFKSANAFGMRYGSGANQVLDGALSGENYTKTGLGLVKSGSSIDGSGTNLFGLDYYYQNIRNELCVLSCLLWFYGSTAGVWGVYFYSDRTFSSNYVGGRAACYPL